MAVDITQPVPNSAAPTPLTPEEALLTKIVAPQVQATVNNAFGTVNSTINDVKTDVGAIQNTIDAHDGVIGILKSTADAHSAQITALEQKVGSALVKAAVDNAKAIVLILVTAVVIGILAWWGAYLAGSSTAKDSWEAVPGAIILLSGGLATYFKVKTPTTTVGG